MNHDVPFFFDLLELSPLLFDGLDLVKNYRILEDDAVNSMYLGSKIRVNKYNNTRSYHCKRDV